MSDDSWHDDAIKTVASCKSSWRRVCRHLFFVVIALSMAPLLKPPAAMPPISLTLFASPLSASGLIARAILLWKITTKARREILSGTYTPFDLSRRNRPAPWRMADAVMPSISCRSFRPRQYETALLEGWAFFAAIAYLLRRPRGPWPGRWAGARRGRGIFPRNPRNRLGRAADGNRGAGEGDAMKRLGNGPVLQNTCPFASSPCSGPCRTRSLGLLLASLAFARGAAHPRPRGRVLRRRREVALATVLFRQRDGVHLGPYGLRANRCRPGHFT